MKSSHNKQSFIVRENKRYKIYLFFFVTVETKKKRLNNSREANSHDIC